MKRNWQQLIEKTGEVRLPEAEKARTRELLMRYMRMNPVNPVRESGGIRHEIQRVRHIIQLFTKSPFYKPMIATAILLIAITAGGGVSLAAEDAIPGDALYPVKVGINESVRSALAVSTAAKAEWKAEQAARRLQEAERLAQQGSLSAEVAGELETKFEQHAESASQEAAKLQAQGRAEVAVEAHSNFEAELRAHQKILETLKSAGQAVEQLRVKVEAQTKLVETARQGAEAEVKARGEVELKAAAEGKLQAAQNKIAEVRSFLTKIQIQAGIQATADAEAKLQTAEKIVADGQTKVAAGAHGEASVLFQEAIRVAQEAETVAQAGVELQIDLGGQAAPAPQPSPEPEPAPSPQPPSRPIPLPSPKVELEAGGAVDIEL